MNYFTERTGAPVRIGRKLGHGGEGAVFEMNADSSRVAKVYHARPSPEKVAKLERMTALRTAELARVAAWPIDILRDGERKPVGFTMPRLSARRDIHELYSVKSRADIFPNANFPFLVHVGANIARAFALIHSLSVVVGDVNQENILVAQDGTVGFIDCDSFQLSDGTRYFTCDVGVPLFTPPELHGQSFRGLVRTPDHDRFGLAVLLFHLLFMGRHPFAGIYKGSGEMPPDRAIAEYRFAYSKHSLRSLMDRPPNTLPLNAVGQEVGSLFEAAFEHDRAVHGRPTAEQWIAGLEALKRGLIRCERNSSHEYLKDSRDCPWCKLEAGTGLRLFGWRASETARASSFDLATLWSRIERVPRPDAGPVMPSARAWLLPAGVRVPSTWVRDLRKALAWLLLVLGFVGGGMWDSVLPIPLAVFIAFIVWPRVSHELRRSAETALTNAQNRWNTELDSWRLCASPERFVKKFTELESSYAELTSLADERGKREAMLRIESVARQRSQYLDRFRLDRGRIKDIGPARIALLASFGIETAADATRHSLGQVPGFGPALTARLLDWRRGHERNFRPDPREFLTVRDRADLDREFDQKRNRLVSLLAAGPDELTRINQSIQAERLRLYPLLESAWSDLKIAELRHKAL